MDDQLRNISRSDCILPHISSRRHAMADHLCSTICDAFTLVREPQDAVCCREPALECCAGPHGTWRRPLTRRSSAACSPPWSASSQTKPSTPTGETVHPAEAPLPAKQLCKPAGAPPSVDKVNFSDSSSDSFSDSFSDIESRTLLTGFACRAAPPPIPPLPARILCLIQACEIDRAGNLVEVIKCLC